MRQSRFPRRMEVAKSGVLTITIGKTPYDVLGVPRDADGQAIRIAFRTAAKSYHPDRNAGDPRAEQHFRQLAAAYEILKRPEKRAAYDRYMAALEENRRRERVRSFVVPAVASLVSGSIVAAVVWLSVLLSHTRVASGPPPSSMADVSHSTSQQVAVTNDSSGDQDRDGGRVSDWTADAFNRHLPEPSTAGQSEPQVRLATEWEQAEASGGLMAIWAFAVRNPDAPEHELAHSKLMALIDAAEDVSLLHVLRLAATDAIAERAHERLVRLGALAVDKADSAMSDMPSSGSQWAASVDEANKAGIRIQRPAATPRPPAKRHIAKQHIAKQRAAAKQQQRERRIQANVQEVPCGATVHGRCIGRDPDPTVRSMIRHDSSLVND